MVKELYKTAEKRLAFSCPVPIKIDATGVMLNAYRYKMCVDENFNIGIIVVELFYNNV